MDFFATSTAPSRQSTDCAIVGVYDKGVLSDAAAELDGRIGGRIARLIKRGDLRGKTGDVLMLSDVSGARCERVVVIGLGAKSGFNRKQYRRALSAALTAIARTGARDAVSYLSLETVKDADVYALARTAAEVAGNSAYRIPDHKTVNKRTRLALTRFGVAAGSRGDRNNIERGLRTRPRHRGRHVADAQSRQSACQRLHAHVSGQCSEDAGARISQHPRSDSERS